MSEADIASFHGIRKEMDDDAASLIAKGIPADHIRSYGFAFDGKNVLIGSE